jgi:type II secretory pathway pseudopilin PulG
MSRVDTRRQGGFVLPEVLLVMVLGIILLGGTLLTFERLVFHEGEQDRRNDTAEMARSALDNQARQLRNLAKRITFGVIDTAAPNELIFQTSDPTRTWVRYCLDTTDPTNATLIEQTQNLNVASAGSAVTAAMRAGCPSTNAAWSTRYVVGTNIVNQINGQSRPMLTYRCAGGGTACTNSSATFDRIIGIDATLYVDTTPNRNPPEQRVSTGVYLRNQNQAPVGEFSSTPVAGASRTVLLNASGSTDFEQRTLSYYWFVGTQPGTANIRCDQPGDVADTVVWGVPIAGRGLTLQYTWPGTVPSGSTQTVGLVACDPGDRFSYVTNSVTVP